MKNGTRGGRLVLHAHAAVYLRGFTTTSSALGDTSGAALQTWLRLDFCHNLIEAMELVVSRRVRTILYDPHLERCCAVWTSGTATCRGNLKSCTFEEDFAVSIMREQSLRLASRKQVYVRYTFMSNALHCFITTRSDVNRGREGSCCSWKYAYRR